MRGENNMGGVEWSRMEMPRAEGGNSKFEIRIKFEGQKFEFLLSNLIRVSGFEFRISV